MCDLSVILVTHQNRDVTLRCLRSAIDATGSIDAEWFVVDSGSTDGAPDAVEEAFPGVTVIRRPNIGFAAGNNVALPLARGRHVLLLNPDIEVVSGTLADLVAAMDARPEVGMSSVVTHYPDGERQATIRRFPSAWRQLGEALMVSRLPGLTGLQEDEVRPGPYETECSVEWVAGSFMLTRRDAVEQVGGLDERFFLFSEEADWCRRVRDAGWDIRHLPAMRVVHHCGRSSRPDLYAQNSHAKVLYARKHFSSPASAAFRGALALRHAIRYAGFAPRARRREELRPRAEAERRALRVVLGIDAPPFVPYRERAGAAG